MPTEVEDEMILRRFSLVIAIAAFGAGCGHQQRPPVRANEPPPPGDNFSATALEGTPTPPAVPPGSQPPVHRPPSTDGKTAPAH
jgi:hypothetical protein